MSKRAKLKNAIAVMDDLSLPKDDQSIVKLVEVKGKSIYEVVTPEGEKYLVTMPTRFRKILWAIRGSYLLVEPIEDAVEVKAEIVKVLDKPTIRHFKKNNVWPPEFISEEESKPPVVDEEGLIVNVNRLTTQVDSSDLSSDDDSSNCDDDDSSSCDDDESDCDDGESDCDDTSVSNSVLEKQISDRKPSNQAPMSNP